MGQLEQLQETVDALVDEVRQLRSQQPKFKVGDVVLVEVTVKAIDEGDGLPYKVSLLGLERWVSVNMIRGKA